MIECSYHTTFRNEVKMDSLHSTMNQHIKGKHLSFEERVIIQLRLKDGWSLDVCSNRATAASEFASSDVVCTKTLYNYVDQGLLGIYNYDLPEIPNFIVFAKIRKNLAEALKNVKKKLVNVMNSVIGNAIWFSDIKLKMMRYC